ncbi:MAG: EAL domain-containing protein, partial [Alphaproteobacteria bacterium]|nr:EAL domain-containing protein [Alphaproteobacteria bacterium]
GHAILQEKPFFIIPDATKDPRFSKNPLVTGAPHIRAYCGRPIRSRSGFPIGTLCALAYEPYDFDDKWLESFNLFAELIEEAIYCHISGEFTRFVKAVPSLGAQSANRIVDNQEFVERTIDLLNLNSDIKYCAMQIAMPHLSSLSKVYGKAICDEILHDVCDRLRVCLRNRQFVLGYGAYSDLVALCSVEDHNYCLAVLLEELEDTFGNGFLTSIGRLRTPIIFGIDNVSGPPSDSETKQVLMQAFKNARTAIESNTAPEPGLYFEKYVPGMSKLADLRQTVASELEDAILSNKLDLHFQPKVLMENLKISGVEALLRWQHPELGWISPLEIVKKARELGIEAQLDRWVIRRACETFVSWKKKGVEIGSVSLNITSYAILRKNFKSDLLDIAQETGMNLSEIELEILEDSIIENFKEVVDMLNDLRALGVNISLDDFGTGQSSLGYIQSLPIDIIKIDRSFFKDIVENRTQSSLVRQIIELGWTLNVQVVAEGIENVGQYLLLRSFKCDKIQGYYFSRPLPSADLVKLYLETNGILSPPSLDKLQDS